MDFENDIIIDPSALDEEWINQPTLALQYSNYWAKCAHTLDQLNEEIKLLRAELVNEVTSDPEGCLGKGMKATGPIIEAYYRNHQRHIEQKEKIVKAQYEVNIAEVAKKEITVTRKAALENLVKLLGLNYFAGPSIPREISYSAAVSNKNKAIDKETNKSIGKRLKRRKD